MGLLSSTYVTNNYHTTEVVCPDALTDNTEALEELADATRKLSKSIDRGRIKISHDRYSELKNKHKLFNAIQEFMNNYVSIAYSITLSENFKQIKEVIENRRYLTMKMTFNGPLIVSENLRLDWNDDNKTCNLYIKGELYKVKEPNYIPQTDGEADINDSEYKSLLKSERLLPKYVNAVEELPQLMYELLNWKYSHFVDDVNKKSRIEWISYCSRTIKAYGWSDYWLHGMNCGFDFTTSNFKWELKTRVNDREVYLKLL